MMTLEERNRQKLKEVLDVNGIKFFNPYEVETGEDKAVITNFDYELSNKSIDDETTDENKHRFCSGLYKDSEFGYTLQEVLEIRKCIEESVSNHFINMLEIGEKVAVKEAKAILTNVLLNNEKDIIYCFISDDNCDNHVYLVHFYLDSTFKVEAKYINEFDDEHLYD